MFTNEMIETYFTASQNTTPLYWEKAGALKVVPEEEMAKIRAGLYLIIRLFVLPIILAVGVFGNIAIVIIACQKHNIKSPVYLFFLAIAVTDLTYLIVGLFWAWWLRAYYKPNVDGVDCKIAAYLVCVTSFYATWAMACLTGQRAITIVWPHHTKALFTRQKVVKFLIGLAVFSFLFHAHKLYVMNFKMYSKRLYRCRETTELDYVRYFIMPVWFWVELTLLYIAPHSVIFVSNAVLIKTVIFSIRKARKHLSRGSSEAIDKRQNQLPPMIALIIAVSTLSVVLYMPVRLMPLIPRDYFMTNRGYEPTFLFLQFLEHDLTFVASSMNFYVYCMSGSLFRKEIKRCISMFTCSAVLIRIFRPSNLDS